MPELIRRAHCLPCLASFLALFLRPIPPSKAPMTPSFLSESSAPSADAHSLLSVRLLETTGSYSVFGQSERLRAGVGMGTTSVSPRQTATCRESCGRRVFTSTRSSHAAFQGAHPAQHPQRWCGAPQLLRVPTSTWRGRSLWSSAVCLAGDALVATFLVVIGPH